MIMRISQLQEPYKTLAKFFKKDNRDLLGRAFEWATCTGRHYDSHSTFWHAVDKGETPEIPKGIVNYYEKKSGKKLPVVMGILKSKIEELKVKSQAPKLERDYKEELRLADEAIANWEEMCETLREDKEYWFQIADQAHKNEEAMLKELDSNLDRAAFHCSKVAETTGSITIDDVTYCLDLVKRVMHHQFAYKPKQEEV
jgi:hypothetical protein